MAIGDRILATRFNSIQTKVGNVLGTGSGDYGYGQTVTSSQVSIGDKITEAQWDNLRVDIIKAHRHQNGISPTITDITGTPMRIAWAHLLQYETLADALVTYRTSVYTGATSGDYTQQAIIGGAVNYTWPSGWNSSQTKVWTLTWSSANAARFFFNSGGYINFTSVLNGVESPNLGWTNVCSGMNNAIQYTAANYAANSNAYRIVSDAATNYTSNYAEVTMAKAGGNVINVTAFWNDAKTTVHPGWGTDEAVGNSITVGLNLRIPTGEFSQATPTIT